MKYDAVKVSYDGETKEIEGRAKGDAAYYKLRDLTNLIGAEMHWDKDTKHITIRLDEKGILLGKDRENYDSKKGCNHCGGKCGASGRGTDAFHDADYAE